MAVWVSSHEAGRDKCWSSAAFSPSPFLFSQGPQPIEGCHSHSESISPSQLTLSWNSLSDTARGVSPRWLPNPVMLTVEMNHHIHESKFPTQRSSRQDDTQGARVEVEWRDWRGVQGYRISVGLEEDVQKMYPLPCWLWLIAVYCLLENFWR